MEFTEAALQWFSYKKMFGKYALKLWENIHAVVPDFNKVVFQIYWNHTSAWVFSCKFAGYFWNTIYFELLWRAASESSCSKICKRCKNSLAINGAFFLCYFQKHLSVFEGHIEGKSKKLIYKLIYFF